MAAREAQVAAGGPGLGGLPGLAGDAGHRLVVSAVRHHAPHPRLAVFYFILQPLAGKYLLKPQPQPPNPSGSQQGSFPLALIPP